MSDSKNPSTKPQNNPSSSNSSKEWSKWGELAIIVNDLLQKRREALRFVSIGGTDDNATKSLKDKIAGDLIAFQATCKDRATFERLVDSVIDIMSRQSISLEEIRKEATEKINKLRDECPRPINIFDSTATWLKENTDGSLRGPTKEALEDISDLDQTEVQNLAQTLLTNPRKMWLFLHAWESGDPKWKAHVQKNKPKSFAMLDAFYGSFLGTLGIKTAGSQERVMEVMSDRSKSESREKVFNEKFEIERASLLKKLEQIAKLQAGATYGFVGDFSKESILTQRGELEKLLQTEISMIPRNNGNFKKLGTLLIAIDHISRLKIRTLTLTAQEDEKKLIEAAFKTVQTGKIYGVQAISTSTSETHSTSDALTGAVHTAVIEKKKMLSVVAAEWDLLKAFQNQPVSEFNSENFANYLSILDLSGELNLASLVQKLWKNKAYEVSLLWLKGDTKAQIKLQADKKGGTLIKTRNIFKEIVGKMNEVAASNPKEVEAVLEKHGLKNSKEILANISSPDFLPQLIVGLTWVDPKANILKIILEITSVTSAENKSKSAKASIDALEGVFSHKTPIRDIVKRLAHGSLMSLPLESRKILESAESFEKLLIKSDTSLADTRKVFEELIKSKLLGEDEVKAYRVVEKYIESKPAERQQAVISKDTQVQKRLVTSVQTTHQSIKTQEKKAGRVLTNQEAVVLADSELSKSGTKEIIFLKGVADDARHLSSKEVKELKEAWINPLRELVGFNYTWEQVVENSALHTKFRLAFNAVSEPSAELIKMNDTVLGLMENELLRRAKDGTINQYHEDNQRAEAIWVYETYNPYSAFFTPEDRKAEPIYRDRSDRFSENNRGNEWYQADTFSNSVSYTAELSRAEHIPNWASSGEIFSRLTPECPVFLGKYLICESKSGAITLIQGDARPIEVDPKQSAAAIILANISTKLGLDGFGPVLKEMLPLIARDDLLAKTRDGSSVREEALIIARIGQTLGLDITGDMSTPEAVLRSMDLARRSLPHTPSYTWLARSRGLATANGQMSVSAFTSAFRNTRTSVKASESVTA